MPLKETKVKVFDDNFFFDDLVGATTTDIDGTFSINGYVKDIFGVPHVYVVIGHTYSNILEIDGVFGIPRYYRTPAKEIQDNVDFGDIFISDDHCRAYVHFYDAINDYTNRTGLDLPYETLHVHTHALIHGGTPYALLVHTFVPRDYPLTLETAKHELAHTVRHTLVRTSINRY